MDHRDEAPDRRRFLGLIGRGSLLAALLAACGRKDEDNDHDADDRPGAKAPAPKAGAAAKGPVDAGAVSELKDGAGKLVDGPQGKVWVVKQGDQVKAHSAVCTHKGCLVKWDATKEQFDCPCHRSVFAADGKVVSGPATAPLPEVKVETRNGHVYV